MNTRWNLLAFVAISVVAALAIDALLLGESADAQRSRTPLCVTAKDGGATLLLDGADLSNSNSTGRTVTIDIPNRSFTKAIVEGRLTRAAATSVDYDVTYARFDNTNFASRTSQSVSSGTVTTSNIAYEHALNSNENFTTEMGITGARALQIVASGDNSNSSDALDLLVQLCAE